MALFSVCNTPPTGHTYSPAQHLFGRVLHSDLPQTAGAVEPASPPRDTAVQEHITRKLQLKRAYDKWADFPLSDLKPSTYVCARPPLTSSSKAWNPGEIAGPASPRSYMIKSRGRTLCRNCVQIQKDPSTGRDCTNSTPSESVVPDLLVPNTMTA